jgi:hypothetical protein
MLPKLRFAISHDSVSKSRGLANVTSLKSMFCFDTSQSSFYWDYLSSEKPESTAVLYTPLVRIYRVAEKSVDTNHSLVLTEMLKIKPASQFVERYPCVVSSALNMEDLIPNNFVNSVSN